MIWCPFCYYRVAVGKFYLDVCPHCRKKVDRPLTTDPYQPQQGTRQGHRQTGAPKRFKFDQRGGSDTDATPGSIPSVPTETLHFYKRDK